VAIESIHKEQFDRILPPDLGLESLMVRQIEWFADRAGTTIGTIAPGQPDEGWNYVVLSRDKTGNFQICKRGRGAFSLDDARTDMLLETAAALRSGAETCLERDGGRTVTNAARNEVPNVLERKMNQS
jgi:hypothetical protein